MTLPVKKSEGLIQGSPGQRPGEKQLYNHYAGVIKKCKYLNAFFYLALLEPVLYFRVEGLSFTFA